MAFCRSSQRVSLAIVVLLALCARFSSASDKFPSCPTANCGGRKISIAIDSSGSMVDTDPQNLRINASRSLIESLVSSSSADANNKADLVSVIDFDDIAKVIYPLGDPSGASSVLSEIDSSGGTYIADGVNKSIIQIQSRNQDQTSGKSGIIVLTDGEDSSLALLLKQVANAKALGIRVNFAFLNPFGSITAPGAPDLLKSIIGNGGIYSTINSPTAQKNFVDLVLAHGLTDQDNPNPNGTTALLPGLTVPRLISKDIGTVKFSYNALQDENLNVTVQGINGQILNCKLDNGQAQQILSTGGLYSQAILTYNASQMTNLKLEVSTNSITEGLFSVTVKSNKLNATRSTVISAASTTLPASTAYLMTIMSLFSSLMFGIMTLL
ncbi:MAG: hypothetical protein M1829_006682 [Trizodia sp. TS-e1964]|nr:MAG: hypothetical protein M1829_006682 [Trizodia sp. TS-e1964]